MQETFYFKNFIIQRWINGRKRKLGPSHSQSHTALNFSTETFFNCGYFCTSGAKRTIPHLQERPGASCFTLSIYWTEWNSTFLRWIFEIVTVFYLIVLWLQHERKSGIKSFEAVGESFTLNVLVDHILQPIQPLHDPDSVTPFVAF